MNDETLTVVVASKKILLLAVVITSIFIEAKEIKKIKKKIERKKPSAQGKANSLERLAMMESPSERERERERETTSL